MDSTLCAATSALLAQAGRAEGLREFLKNLGDGDPTTWTIVVATLSPIVLAIVVGMYLKGKRKKPATPEEVIQIAEDRLVKRLLAFPVIVVPSVIGIGIDLSSQTTPVGIVVGLVIALFFGTLILFLNGDCPACRKSLGKLWNPKHCPNCGAQLRKE